MKRIFIDTNVILDFLADRAPFSEHAAILFQLANEGKIELYISAISINNTYYILRKVASHKIAIQLISDLEELVGLQETTRGIIRKALKSNFSDFEDAIQYFSAVQLGNVDIITTRDLKGFKKSDLPVLSPETTVKLLFKEDKSL